MVFQPRVKQSAVVTGPDAVHAGRTWSESSVGRLSRSSATPLSGRGERTMPEMRRSCWCGGELPSREEPSTARHRVRGRLGRGVSDNTPWRTYTQWNESVDRYKITDRLDLIEPHDACDEFRMLHTRAMEQVTAQQMRISFRSCHFLVSQAGSLPLM